MRVRRPFVGCGLNVLNPPPITSLAQLLSDDSGSGGSRPLPTMEGTLAAIMARFERMWAEFVRERGSFEPFMDLYLERWLHSCVPLPPSLSIVNTNASYVFYGMDYTATRR